MALEGLSRGIFRSIGLLKNKRKLDDEELREMTRSLRRALQEADFNVRQTKEIVERMESRLREETPRAKSLALGSPSSWVSVPHCCLMLSLCCLHIVST